MKINIQFSTDNSAFTEYEGEIGRILQEVAESIDRGRTSGKCVDTNGNRVGYWQMED